MFRASLFLFFSIACFLAACPAPPVSAPPPPPIPLTAGGTPEWLDEAAARCARIASCSHAHDAPRLRDPSACIDWWIARVRSKTEPIHTCLLDAKTCDDVGVCVREPGNRRAAEYCAAHRGVMTACDGDALVSCSSDDAEESALLDCASLAGKCEERRTGGLVVRGCFSPKLCPPGAPDERCDGPGAIVSCHDGAAERVACGPGTRCDQHREGNGELSATCEPIAGHAHCSELGARHCQGDVLVECVVHGHFGDVRVSPCKELGLRCAGSGARAACVIDRALECEAGPARCDGESLAFCAAGRMLKVSCGGLGLGPCDPDALGPAAACGPR